MKLTASLTSPYARKVRILLAEKNIDYELVVDAPWETDGGVPELNPLGKVPTLESDEGEIFYDAPMIEGFLEAIERPPHFIPEDGMAAVRVRHTEALADGILDAAVLAHLETLHATPERERIVRQKVKIDRALELLERDLGGGSWFESDRMTMADIAVGVALDYIDLRIPDMDWRERYPDLAAFAARIGTLASFAETRPRR